MSRRATLSSLLTTKPAARAEYRRDEPLSADNAGPEAPGGGPAPVSSSRARNSTMRAMEASLSGLAARVETGSAIVDLDAALIDGSFILDRVADADDPSFSALVESMRESGQQVPVLVRRHPGADGRYQIAYGHRRVRAAALLGRSVRAVVRDLSDAELVVAQGKENLERRDLSYIERAFFALRLEAHGFSREVISAALGEHKSNLSVLIAVARGIPLDLLNAIGPAPKAGRPRWQMLADRIKEAPEPDLAEIAAKASLPGKISDDRFAAVFEALAPEVAAKPPRSKIWRDGDGRKLARIERSKGSVGLRFDDALEPGLADYLISKLPDLLSEFRTAGGKPAKPPPKALHSR